MGKSRADGTKVGPVAAEPLPFASRFLLAWACFFKVLFDGLFAARVAGLSSPELPAPEPAQPVAVEKIVERIVEKATPAAALQLLGLLQREGRLVDFLEQDVVTFSDAEVGAAARVVHEGCRKALRSHVTVEPIRTEQEGATITLDAGFDATRVKLVGNVQGSPPFKGTLRHQGWRATKLSLPESTPGHDASILAPAEVEL